MPLAASRWPSRLSVSPSLGNGGEDLAHRQAEADQAGRADQHVARIAADRFGRRGAHRLGIGAALGAGAGIGVAAVDDHARRMAARHVEPLEAGLDRRRAELVLGEDGGGRHRLAVVGGQQADVAAAAGLDPGGKARGDEAFGKGDAQG